MAAQCGAHHDVSCSVVLGPLDHAGVQVDLSAHAKNAGGEVDVAVEQREDLAGPKCRLSDREDRALQDQPVAVGAARTGTALQPLVLLIGDDLEVGPVDPAYALDDSQASEDVAVDQSMVDGVIEELANSLLYVASVWQRPGQASGRVKLSSWRSPKSRTNGFSPSRIRLTVPGRRPVSLYAR